MVEKGQVTNCILLFFINKGDLSSPQPKEKEEEEIMWLFGSFVTGLGLVKWLSDLGHFRLFISILTLIISN